MATIDTQVTAGPAKLNRFVRHDLMSTDLAGSLAFYQAICPAWQVELASLPGPGDAPAEYARVSVGGVEIAAIIPLDPSHGIPSHWTSYVLVEDCQTAMDRMTVAGGSVCYGPTELPEVCKFAFMNDPQGAFIKPFEALRPMQTLSQPTVGMICWNELLTNDIAGAQTFYQAAFGWDSVEQEMGDGLLYTMFMIGKEQVGGAMPIPAEAAGMPPMWMIYLLVDDLKTRHAQALKLGAEEHLKCRQIPGVGNFSLIRDPQGGMVYLFEFAS